VETAQEKQTTPHEECHGRNIDDALEDASNTEVRLRTSSIKRLKQQYSARCDQKQKNRRVKRPEVWSQKQASCLLVLT